MSSFLQLISILTIIILAAKAAGYLSIKLGQPSVFGELMVGLLLGPSLINLTGIDIFSDSHLGDVVHELGEMGVLLLMFLAGLELELREMARSSRVAAYSGIMGVLLPVGLGYLIGALSGMRITEAIFLGLTLGATSVSISAQTLMELGVLRSRVGLGLLGSAVFDDILVILLLSIFSALRGGADGPLVVLWTIGRMVIFLGLSALVGLYLLPRLAHWIESLGISQGTVVQSLVVMFVFALGAELIGGMAAITGAFIAGLMYARTALKRQIEHGFNILSFGLFVPVFFVDIGLRVDLRQIQISDLWLLILLIAAAIAGKVIGSGVGARAGGFTWRESLQLGVGMVSRGEVGLIVASVGLAEGMLSPNLFAIVVGMVLATTLLTPPLLRLSFSKKKSSTPEAA